MEPQDTFDMQARMNELLNTVFMRRFTDVPEVSEADALAALADMFPKQWAEWLTFAGPGAATHFADFMPIRLACDKLNSQLCMMLYEQHRSTFTLAEAAAKLRTDESRMWEIWFQADPRALEHEFGRLCTLGEMQRNDDGSFTPGLKLTAEAIEDKARAWQREGERLTAVSAALEAQHDYLRATGHFDDAGRPRGHADFGKPDPDE